MSYRLHQKLSLQRPYVNFLAFENLSLAISTFKKTCYRVDIGMNSRKESMVEGVKNISQQIHDSQGPIEFNIHRSFTETCLQCRLLWKMQEISGPDRGSRLSIEVKFDILCRGCSKKRSCYVVKM